MAAAQRFDLPAGAVVPALVGPATGVARLVARPMVESRATVLDTADRRLLSWGVELSRISETGQWSLRAPGWAPLPAEQLSAAAEDDLPTDFAAAIAGFRRGALLGPQLTVLTRRHGFTLVAADQRPLGDLLDEHLLVSGIDGGDRTLRSVILSIREPDGADWAALVATLVDAGAEPTDVESTLGRRLGLTPEFPARVPPEAPIDVFVERRLRILLRRVLTADLVARVAGNDDGSLRAVLAGTRADLAGLSPMLRTDWVDQAAALLDQSLGERVRPLIHTERYGRLLDLLADAVDQVPLDQVSGRQTAAVLAQELESMVQSLVDQCRALGKFTTDDRWRRAGRTAERTLALARQATPIFGKRGKVLVKRLARVRAALTGCVRPDTVALARDLQGLTPTEIFEAGRVYERVLGAVDNARTDFADGWPGLSRRLRAEVIHP